MTKDQARAKIRELEARYGESDYRDYEPADRAAFVEACRVLNPDDDWIR